MGKIILRGYIIVPSDSLVAVKSGLLIHDELTKKELGCIKFEVSQDKNNHNKFNVYEEFIDEEAFNNHQLRVANSKWGEAIR